MAQPELTARLGVDEKDFVRGLNASEASLKGLQDDAKVTAAQIALLEREFASGNGSVELGKKHATLQQHLRETQAEAIATAKQLKALEAIRPAAVAVPLPDESARYQDWLKRADEQERSARAHAAMGSGTGNRAAMPEASRPSALIKTTAEAVETGVAEGAAGGISRMGKMELAHVGRSLGGSLLAGQPVGRALEMEAPRLISALGPAVLGAVGGFAGLAVVLGPLTAAVVAAGAAFVVHNANKAANQQREANAEIGMTSAEMRNETDLDDIFNPKMGDKARSRHRDMRQRLASMDNAGLPSEEVKSTEDLEKDWQAATEEVNRTKQRRHSKFNRFANLFGGGMDDADVQDVEIRRNNVGLQRDVAAERDLSFKNREFDGDPAAARDRAKLTRDEGLTAIENQRRLGKITEQDFERRKTLIGEEYALASKEIERRQQGAERSVELERDILAIKKDGKDVAEKTAQAQLEAAQKALADGPKEGPQHDANLNAVDAAKQGVEDGTRQTQFQKAAFERAKGENDDRANGSESAVTRAQRAYNEAVAKRNAHKEGTDDYKTADQGAVAAGHELENAKQVEAEQRAQREEAKRLAGMDTPAAQKERASLEGQQADLAGQLDPKSNTYQFNAEKRADLEKEKAENAERLRALDRSDKEREFARRSNDIEANARPGNAGKLDTLSQKYTLNRDQAAYNLAGINDPDKASKLNEEAADLLREKQQIRAEEEKSLRAAQGQADVLQLQATGHSNAANEARTRLQYEEKIATALKNGDAAMAAQMSKEQSLAGLSQEIDEALKTPEQRAKDKATQRERERVANSIQHPATRDVGREGSFTPDYRNPSSFIKPAGSGPHSAAVSPDDVSVPDVPSIPDNASLPDNAGMKFSDLPPLPDLRPQIADSHANAGNGDKASTVDNAGIISAINNPTWAEKFALKNR